MWPFWVDMTTAVLRHPQPACSLYSCQTGGCFSHNWELLSEPQLVMLTCFIPVDGKVKYDVPCSHYGYGYTSWDQQSAITLEDAIDVLFSQWSKKYLDTLLTVSKSTNTTL